MSAESERARREAYEAWEIAEARREAFIACSPLGARREAYDETADAAYAVWREAGALHVEDAAKGTP